MVLAILIIHPHYGKIYIAGNVLCLMPVGKDQAEQIVTEDLKKKYPSIERLEFTLFEPQNNEIVLIGRFKVKDEPNYKIFGYALDVQTGEIKKYIII